MPLTRFVLATLVAMSGLLSDAGPATAQGRLEFGPLVGFSTPFTDLTEGGTAFGVAAVYGFDLGVRLTDRFAFGGQAAIAPGVTYGSADARLSFVAVSAQWRFGRPDARTRPYVTAGPGFVLWSSEQFANDSGSRLAANLGIGGYLVPSPLVSLRMEGRFHFYRFDPRDLSPTSPEDSKLQMHLVGHVGVILTPGNLPEGGLR